METYSKTAAEIASFERRMRENREKAELRRKRVKRENALIAEADAEFEALSRIVRDMRDHRNRAPLPGGRKLTLKNSDVARVWMALQEAFTDRFAWEGLANDQLCKAMRAAVPGICESTMRSHLHRFKNKRVLTRIGSRWFLDQPTRDSSKGTVL